MRPVLQNQPEIDKLSAPLGQSLRTLKAAIQTGWNTEHNGDGSHGAITATAAAVSGLTTLGKLRLDYVIFNDPGSGGTLNNITVAGLTSVSWLRIFPAGALNITGIDATGRDTGDLLLLTNCGSAGASLNDITLKVEDFASIAANRFDGGLIGDYVLSGARGVCLIYDYNVTSVSSLTHQPRWRILGN